MKALVGLLLSLFAIFGGMSLEGGNLNVVLQLTPFLIVVGGAMGATLMSCPWKDLLKAIKMIPGSANSKTTALPGHVFSVFGKATLVSGAICFVIGMIHVLENLEQVERMGAGLAVAVVGPLYALLIKLLVSDPLQAKFPQK